MPLHGYSDADWARAAATTLAEHIKAEENAIMRNFQFGALLQRDGRIKYKCSGRGFDWRVRYRHNDVEGNTGETPRNFTRFNPWKEAYLKYRGYQTTDSIFRREYLENRGEQAVIDVFGSIPERLEESLTHRLGTEYYGDGDASGKETDWHGVESMFGTITNTVNITDGTSRAANAADIVGFPSKTYAGLNTQLGNYGGANESGAVWPLGVAQSQYDFWTPIVVNYTSTALGGAADTWAAQGDEAMRYAIIHAQRNSSLDGQVSNIFLSRELYFDFLNLIDDKEQINVTSENSLRALGFLQTVIFDGLEVSWESAIPVGVGYGMNMSSVELRSMEDNLFFAEGPNYDMGSQAWNSALSTLSNLKFKSPRNCFKLMTLA